MAREPNSSCYDGPVLTPVAADNLVELSLNLRLNLWVFRRSHHRERNSGSTLKNH